MLVISAGCNESTADRDRIQKELVFNEFNIEQPRGHFAYIEAEVLDPIVAQQEVFAGFASRSSGVVETERCLANPGATRGSGMMTSSTRFTTALHVVLNDVRDHENDLHSKAIKIHFGSSRRVDDDPDNNVYTGYYKADIPEGDDPFYNQDYRFEEDEEEPFLAMRFFQLGMKEWAMKEEGEEIRTKMRTWNFEYDQVDLDDDDGTFFNQGNAIVNGVDIDGRDIVVLKASKPTDTSSGEFFIQYPVTSGDFVLDRPGVFFDHVTAAPYQTVNEELGEFGEIVPHIYPDTPLWLEHANDWMDANSIVRLISRPGYLIEGGATPVNVKNKCGGIHRLKDLFGATLDTKVGSSGGLVIAPNVGEHLPDSTYKYVTQEMVTVAVNHGHKFDPQNPPQPGWGLPYSVDIDEPWAIYDGLHENWFTGIVDPTVPSRDGPDVPVRNGAPNACTEGEAGNSNCIPCKRWNSDNKCIEIATGPSTPTGSGGPPAYFRDIPVEESDNEGSGDRSVRCSFDALGRPRRVSSQEQSEEYPGMMIGIAGASKGLFGKEDFVSDLYAICAPVGLVSYTENWRFMNLKGSFLPWQISNIHGRRAWGPLHIQANESFTINNNDPPKGHKYRPLPMKFCPPNYYVNGVRWRDDANGVYGITGLRCHNFSNSHILEATGGEEIWVYLDASEEGVEGFQMFGEEYTLDQRIGNPNLGSNTGAGIVQTYECDGGFVSGFDMSHNGGGELEYFYPTCTYFVL